MNVDYKNAEQFESIARSAGFHDFDVMGNGCYADDFLQHFYLGWQASRRAISSYSEIPNNSGSDSEKPNSSEAVAWSWENHGRQVTVDKAFADELISDGEIVRPLIFGDTHPASAGEWIKCSERLPDTLDVWIKMTDGSVVACWSQLDGDFYWNGGGSESCIFENTVTHWKPRQQEKDQ